MSFLHTTAIQNEGTEHAKKQALALAHLFAMPSWYSNELLSHLVTFVEAKQSMLGLESLFLTALHRAWLSDNGSLYVNAMSTWKQLNKHQAKRSEGKLSQQSRSRLIFFIDRATGLSTVMPFAAWKREEHTVLRRLGEYYSVARVLRGLGKGDAADGNSRMGCISNYVTFGAGVGAIVGAALSLVALVIPGGVGIAGPLITGAAAGGSAAGLWLGSDLCTDKGNPGATSGPPVGQGDPTQPGGTGSGGATPVSNPGGTTPTSDPGSTTTTTTDTTDTSTDGADGGDPPSEEVVAMAEPQPDDMFNARFLEFLSTASEDPETDASPGVPIPPQPKGSIWTFALNDLPSVSDSGQVQLGFLSARHQGKQLGNRSLKVA
jgi:hypothetical protein